MMHVSDGLAVSILAKATVVAAAGLMGAWLARGSRAAVRHAVLAASFAVMLGLPVVSMVVPPVRVALPGAPTVFVEAVDAAPQAASSRVGAVAVPAVSRWSFPSIADLLLAGWFAGALCFLLRMMVGLRQVHLLRRFGLPWRDGQVMVDRLVLDVGIRRRVDVQVHESLPAPVTCGVVHPAIVLPPDAQGWAASDLNRALVHELEHVRRGDWVVHCVARIVCAVYWFHPLVWMAWRRLALEAERACDDAVLGGSEATLYADQLVGLERRLSRNRKSPALAMANRSDLSARVGAVLDSGQRRGRAGKMLVASVFAVAAAAVAMMSPLTMAANAPAFEVASVKPDKDDGVGPRNSAAVYGPKGVNFRALALAFIIGEAYHFPVGRIQGAGSPTKEELWAPLREGYDIVAHADHPVSKDELRLMLQSLLADRFHLKVHHEAKTGPVYKLVVARNGPRLEESNAAEVFFFSNGPAGQVFRATDMTRLSGFLSGQMDRPVVDGTGLKGVFNFTLKRPEDLQWDLSRGKSDGGTSPESPSAAAFSDSLKQLGLQLVPGSAPVDYLVIDHVEKPSEN